MTTQIIVLFGTLVAALAVALVLIFGELVRHQAHGRSAAELNVLADNTAKLLAENLQERSREIEVVARSQPLWREGLDAPAVIALIARVRAIRPDNLWIGVADPQGVVRAASADLLLGQNVSERPWFVEGRTGSFVGDVHPAKLLEGKFPPPPSGDPLRLVDFAAPIHVDGTLVGVLGIHLSWDWARQAIARILPTDAPVRGMEVFIFNHVGELIYAPNGRTTAMRSAGQRLPVTARVGAIGRLQSVEIVPWRDGKDYLTSVALLPPRGGTQDLGWRIVAREPEDSSLAPLHNAVLAALGIACLVALAVGAAAGLGARRLGQDLRRVADAAEAVDARVVDAMIPVLHSSAEVARLSGALQRMTQRLLAANAQMQERVRERTADLEEANRALEQMVHHDPLTGALNRRGLHLHGARLVAMARRSFRPLCLLMLDADHFKAINDTHGHPVGDEVLRFLAGSLRARLRSSDIIARWGGEEFVVLLPESSLAQGQQIAEQLREAIMAHQSNVWGRVTVSIGVAELTGPVSRLEDLVRRADEALYSAKERGRNQVAVASALW